MHDINYSADYNDYVTRYYGDGDFRYAEGLKPITEDLRHNVYEIVVDNVTQKRSRFLPLYPDDYIFFGQKLTYGLLTNSTGSTIPHDWHPVAVAKNHTRKGGDEVDNSLNGLLINDIDNMTENRVYRAPAYFCNGTYGRSVMFNANAVFTDSYDYTVNGHSYSTQPHHLMTAVDFTGGNGDTQGYQGVVAGIASDFKSRSDNYKPLLDFERLDGILTNGITQNLLTYTPSVDLENTKNTQTNSVLVNYFRDLAYEEGADNPDYRTVAVQLSSDVNRVLGHVVQQTSTTIASGKSDYTYQAATDHFLVDKQDFNAPMAYTCAPASVNDSDNSLVPGKRMWYQRIPDNDNYVELDWSPERSTKGWEGICLPFEAELVTTQQKGELTHFYKKAGSDKFERGYDSGHEYWLRRFAGGALKTGDNNVFEANFKYPDAGTNVKEYTNTFLWDYYYQELSDARPDDNEDTYQQQYYAEPQTYNDYPYSKAGMPYIVGFPGSSFYEFDLSGNFVAQNTLNDIDVLNPQIITFASEEGASIGVSDSELATGTTTLNGYAFTPNYLNTTIDAGSYVLNDDGTSYEQTSAAADAVPFRPYFTVASGGGAKEFRAARAITFNRISTSLNDEEESEPDERLDGELIITSKRGRILVKSSLMEETTVQIVNAGGALVRVFTIKPGQTVETQAAQGIYIVNKKKISVR